MPGAARAVNLPPANLRELAAHATQRETWPKLRNYAKNQTDPGWSGWAYFLVGYQEYQGRLYRQAAEDLAEAAKNEFSLADYAVFYQASSFRQDNRPQDAAVLLQDFASRFPHGRLLDQVLAMRASALLSAEQAQAAVDALLAEPATHKHSALALLLGQAYMQAQHLGEAAATFQNVYYNFPLSSEAKPAADALSSLRNRMGTGYPEPVGAWKIARVEALFKAGRYADALSEYSDLLKSEPSSPLAPRWQLGRARCLWRLQRSADALQVLFTRYDAPELESQRLALLVHVHTQQSDVSEVTQDLAQLEASYSSSPAYADALSAAGMFYYRQLNWQEAARNFRRLWDLFPQDNRLRDDGWRLGWCDYLLGDAATAEVMHKYLMQFPDSARAPAALYWLGQVEEDQGAIAEARALYALLVNRFAHTYYAAHASAHLATLKARQGSAASPNDSTAAPLAAALIPVLTPPVVPPGLACAHDTPIDAAGPALILHALDLLNLEQDVLKAAVAGENPPVELRLLLAGTYSAQGNASSALFGALKTAPGYSQMEFSDLPEEVWDLLYPQAYSKLIATQARLNNLDPYLVMGLIRQESAFSPHALSNANARGLMQVLPQTAARTTRSSRVRAAGQRLYDSNYNVRVGCAYLAQLLKEFDGQPEFAVAAYNAGDSRVKEWMKKYTFRDRAVFLESIPITATRNYVELVLRDAEVYRQLLTGTPHFAQCSQGQAAGEARASDITPCDGMPVTQTTEGAPGE
jgi:soluble lytic murein transglycosylase